MLTALILGDAKCVYADAHAALAMFEPDAVFATNNIGISWPGRVDYWCTLHPTEVPNWPGIVEAVRRRQLAGLNRPQVWGHRRGDAGIDRWTEDWAGSTGLLAFKVAIEEGFSRIVFAGVPMTAEAAHFYDAEPWRECRLFQKAWLRHTDVLHKARSMSGWTKDLLGEPTEAWLAG